MKKNKILYGSISTIEENNHTIQDNDRKFKVYPHTSDNYKIKLTYPIIGNYASCFILLFLIFLLIWILFLKFHNTNNIILNQINSSNIILIESNHKEQQYFNEIINNNKIYDLKNKNINYINNQNKCYYYNLLSNNSYNICNNNNNNDNKSNYPDKSYIYLTNNKKYQKILGFGIAFTEASGYNFNKLNNNLQNQIIKSYFSTNSTLFNNLGGIGLTLGRSHINSCDFSLSSYSFDNITNDYDLLYFDNNVTHDLIYLIPLIKKALNEEKNLKIQSAPWSPPGWMKVPINNNIYGEMDGSSTPHGLIWTDKILKSWSLYISKWITAYKNHGINIWGISIQNEPENPASWEACVYNSTYEKLFLHNYLGPQLRNDHPDIKILIFDHNKDHIYDWTYDIYNDNKLNLYNKKVKDYVDGVDFHWYTNTNTRELDGTYGYYNLNKTYNIIKNDNKLFIASEAASCPGVIINDWLRGQRVAHDIIYDFYNNVNAWQEWNLLVDSEGGPNHLNNNCDAPIVTTKLFDNIIYQPRFYFLGHFSKFIRPDSYRIYTNFHGIYNNNTFGGNSNSLENYEITLFNCEKSTRQMWKFNNDNQIELWDPSIENKLCLSNNIDASYGLSLVLCNSDNVGIWNYINNQFILMNDNNNNNNKCLIIQDNSYDIGARVTIGDCNDSNNIISSYWDLNKDNYDIISLYNYQCITSGWPFFQGIAFELNDDDSNENLYKNFTKDKKKIGLIVLNEADDDIEFDIVYENEYFNSKINGKSIQTYIWEINEND